MAIPISKRYVTQLIQTFEYKPTNFLMINKIPLEELSFFQKEGARREKALPIGLSQNDSKILKKVRSRAYHLDLGFECCCGIQVGWAGLIGLIPWIGDIIALYLALQLVKNAQQIEHGLPKYILTQMYANVSFDFGIGLIPLVGDLINIAYKANSRNCMILETFLKKNAKNKRATGGSTLQETLHV
ncbi:hypothetical protein WICMUC_004395 [Wickerhamomyces mucosus]|uniref:DUF4112 domain-containing protein n=1 Tax=Wickerhamomyces mucosus TaxID=1378264 RepID=A0A9P8PIL4_9ASCO|nr:hypothetical protein WICMUC_004395 [Wickerhamomyces mucosus]